MPSGRRDILVPISHIETGRSLLRGVCIVSGRRDILVPIPLCGRRDILVPISHIETGRTLLRGHRLLGEK